MTRQIPIRFKTISYVQQVIQVNSKLTDEEIIERLNHNTMSTSITGTSVAAFGSDFGVIGHVVSSSLVGCSNYEHELPTCVEWKDKNGDSMWCVAEDELDEDASEDPTLCNKTVILRLGDGKRIPTCPDCLKELGMVDSKVHT